MNKLFDRIEDLFEIPPALEFDNEQDMKEWLTGQEDEGNIDE